jgi:hypothetical protein
MIGTLAADAADYGLMSLRPEQPRTTASIAPMRGGGGGFMVTRRF